MSAPVAGAGTARRLTASIASTPAWLMVLVSIVSVQVGGAVAAGLVWVTNPMISVSLRHGIAALLLLAFVRPVVRLRDRRDWLAVILMGLSMATMTASYYAAIATIPLGVATTVAFLGPLGFAAFISHRRRDMVASVVALAGVVAVSGVLQVDLGRLDVAGLAFAALGGATWVTFILTTKAVGRRWQQLDGLAVATAVAGILVLPVAIVSAPPDINLGPPELVRAVGVAVLATVVPFSLQLAALRRISTAAFGILGSMEPAMAAIVGLVILGQGLSALQAVGIGLVVVASSIVMVEQHATPEVVMAEIT